MEIGIKFKDNYEISNLGKVRNIKTGQILKSPTNRHGYANVNIRSKKFSKILRIHRILAEAFIPNPENKSYVNHKDGNKLNNSLENLEWCTQAENISHAKNTTRTMRVLSRKKINKIFEKYKGSDINELKQIILSFL